MAGTLAGARTEIAALLETVTASVGNTTYKIKVVHEFPVASIPPGETPCVIIALPEPIGEPRRMGGTRFEEYTLGIGLFVQDASVVQAMKILDAFRSAVIAKFDGNVQLGGACDYLIGPRATPGTERYAGIDYPHIEFECDVRVSVDVLVEA